MLKIIKILSFIVFVSILSLLKTQAQEFGSNQRFSVSMLKDTLSLNPGQFGFNSITVTNHTNTRISLGSKFEMPRGWSLLRQFPSYLEIEAGQSKTFPLRIKTSPLAYGGKNYTVSLHIEDPLRGQNTIKYFGVKINTNTNWRANLMEHTKFAYESEGLPDFQFRIRNIGNRVEAFDISFKSNLRLTVPSSGFQIILKPGADSLITVGIRSRTLGQISDEITINIEARNSRKILIQNLYIVSNKFKPRESSNYYMPISIKWMGINLLEPKNIFQYVEAEGYLELEDEKAVSFRIRTNSFGTDFNLNKNLIQLNYHTKRSNLSLGTQQDYMFTPIDGNGVRFDFYQKRSRYEIFALKGRYIKNFVLGIRQDVSLKEEAVINTEGLYNNNFSSGVASIFGIHTYKKRLKNGNNLSFRAGYSAEKAASIGELKPGFAAGYSYYNHSKIFSISSNLQYFSPWFPGINRGTTFQNHNLDVKWRKMSFGVFGNKLYREPFEYNLDFSDARKEFSSDNKEYGVQIGAKFLSGNILLKASKSHQLYFNEENPEVTSQKLSLEYFFRSKKMEQMISFSTYKSRYPAEGMPESILSYSTFVRGKIKDFGYMSRFDYGPIFYYDFLYQHQTGEFPIRHQHSVFYENSKAEKVKSRFSANFFAMGKSARPSLNIRSDVFWDMPRIGMSVNVFASVDVLNFDRVPSFSISLTKALKIPVPFVKKFKTLKVAMYKDRNNNNIWDTGEEAIKNADVLVNDKYLISNEKGEVTLQNVIKDDYIVNYSTVSNQMGWIPNSIVGDTIHLDRNKRVEIPFKMSDIVSGKVEVFRAAYSKNPPPDLEGLLVIAKNEKGEVFRAVVNENGHFFFNLNEGIYKIEIPNNIFGKDFYFENRIQSINLYEKSERVVSFELKERKRKLKIRRQND